MTTLGHFIFTGILERFPKLRVAILESNAGWLPFWLERLDLTQQDILLRSILKHYPDEEAHLPGCGRASMERSKSEIRARIEQWTKELAQLLYQGQLSPSAPGLGFVSKHRMTKTDVAARVRAIDWFANCGKRGEFDVTAVGEDLRLRFPEGMRSTVDANLAVQGRAELEIRDPAIVAHVHSGVPVGREEHVLESSSVQLKRRHWREPGGSELEPIFDAVVSVRREEVAQPELRQVVAAQQRLEPKHVLKVMSADLDRRLSDLEGRFRHRMLTLLAHEHAKPWRFEMELPRQCEAGEPAPGNHRIVSKTHRRVGSDHGLVLGLEAGAGG
jgi:hypothetical protein